MVTVDALPMLPSGKVDRARLPALLTSGFVRPTATKKLVPRSDESEAGQGER